MRNQIEGIHVLRGVAATMVVLHHALYAFPNNGWPQFGPAGVDIFFVISGFVMCLTTQAAPAGHLIGRSRQAAEFGWRRILRIVPLYWLAILWTARHQLGNPAVLKDLLFIPRANPATPGLIRPVLNQGWTLNFEMLFYVIFAVGMLFGRVRFLIVALGLVMLASLTALGFGGTAATFYSNSIVLEFGFGILLFRFQRFPAWSRATYLAILALGFVLLAEGWGHGPRAVSTGLPALLIVWSSLKACEGWLKSRFLVLLGDASYAIYLFHWASFGALKPLVHAFPQDQNLLILAHVIVGVNAGIAVHLVVEKRINSLVKRLRVSPRLFRQSEGQRTLVGETRVPACSIAVEEHLRLNPERP